MDQEKSPRRMVCTKEHPWKVELGSKGYGWNGVEHPDSELLGSYDFDGEFCEKYKCRICGKIFYQELPR